MVTVVKRSQWAFWRYEQIYQIDLPHDAENIRDSVLNYFGRRKLRHLVVSAESIEFDRGSLLGSIFSSDERAHKQRVNAAIHKTGSSTRITCRYQCLDPYPNLHLRPHMLQCEVEALALILQEQEPEKKHVEQSHATTTS